MRWGRLQVVVALSLSLSGCNGCKKPPKPVPAPNEPTADAGTTVSTASNTSSTTLKCAKQVPPVSCGPKTYTQTTAKDTRRTHVAQTLDCSLACVEQKVIQQLDPFPTCCKPMCTGLLYGDDKLLTANHCGVPNYVRHNYFTVNAPHGTLSKLVKVKSYAQDFTVFETQPRHGLSGITFANYDPNDAFTKLGHDKANFLKKTSCAGTMAANVPHMFYHCCFSDGGGSGSPFFVGNSATVAGIHSCGSASQHNVGTRADVLVTKSPSICKLAGFGDEVCGEIQVEDDYGGFWKELCDGQPSEWCSAQVVRAESFSLAVEPP